MTSDGRWTYAWDAENRLKSMETQSAAISAGVPAQRLEFAYDAQGRRVRKVVRNLSTSGWVATSDLRYLYDGWNLIAELEKSARLPAPAPPRLLRAYAWGRDLSGTEQGVGGVGGLVLAEQRRSMTTTGGGQPTSSTLAPTYDGNGNISAYVDLTNGRVMARLDYDAFGKPVWSEVGDTMGARSRIPFGFSTKYEDPETGMLYYGYRYYAPEMGRWLSRDPIEESGGINLYGMVGNDTINNLDPDGRAPMQGGIGGPQAIPPGGFSAPTRYPGRNYSLSNINQLFEKIDKEGKASAKCPDSVLCGVRNTKKMLLQLALNWNRNSLAWAKNSNECYGRADKLSTYLNQYQPTMIRMNNGDKIWSLVTGGGNVVTGGQYIPGFRHFGNHNVMLVLADYWAKRCDFKDFYIDPYKGPMSSNRNSEGRIGSNSWEEFKKHYPGDAVAE